MTTKEILAQRLFQLREEAKITRQKAAGDLGVTRAALEFYEKGKRTPDGYGIVAPTLIQYHSENAKDEVRGQSVDEPLMTQDTSNRYAISCAHIMKNYAGGYQGAGSKIDRGVFRAKRRYLYHSRLWTCRGTF